MFRERNLLSEKGGWIEVICGSMFSGKTEELLRRLRRAEIAKLTIETFKPQTDTRYSEVEVVSHDAGRMVSQPVATAADILKKATRGAVIGIDEAQFFDNDLAAVASELANSGCRVIIAGLDMDFSGKPFGPIPEILARAEYITKLHAICVHCGGLASFSYRKSENEKQVLLGSQEAYEPLCRACYQEAVPNAADKR